ncbi:hypothetical protein BC827DRAFT_1087768, partial [Russula dissimulans]
ATAKMLATSQHAGAMAITGSLRTSPTDTLNTISYLLPVELTIVKLCQNAFTHMVTLPKDHPLYRPVNSQAELRVIRHCAPIHNLRMLFDRIPTSLEKIPSTTRNPALHGKHPFEISIAEDCPSSIEEAENANEDLVIYSDGSALKGKVGVAAICY